MNQRGYYFAITRAYFLKTITAKNQMLSNTTNTARQFLSLTNLKQIQIPIPPIEEQFEILNILNEKTEYLKQVKSKLKVANEQQLKILKFYDDLKHSLLQLIFTGSLLN